MAAGRSSASAFSASRSAWCCRLRPDGFMLAALNLGHFGVKVHASQDAGATWTEVATPAYPVQPEGAGGVPWKLVQIWSLSMRGETIWAGTLARRICFARRIVASPGNWSTRSGRGPNAPSGSVAATTFPAFIRSARIRSVTANCSSASAAAAPGSRATTVRTGRCNPMACAPTSCRPNAPAIPNIQDPHSIVRCEAQPDVLWCQHHCGIWRSIDNAVVVATSDERAGIGLRVCGCRASAAMRTRPGSCPRSPTSAVCRRTVRSSSIAPVMAVRASRRCATGCRNRTATTSSTATALRSRTTVEPCLMGSTTGGLWASRRCRRPLADCLAHAADDLRRALRVRLRSLGAQTRRGVVTRSRACDRCFAPAKGCGEDRTKLPSLRGYLRGLP